MSNEEQAEIELGATLENNLRGLSEAGLEPERDLWPDLAVELGARESSSTVVRWHQRTVVRLSAAAAVLLIGLVLAWQFTGSASQPTRGFSATRSSADLPAESSPVLQAAFASYIREREVLLEALARELGKFPPGVRAEIGQSIDVIEAEMKEIETSLTGLPVEPATEMRLADLYEMELRLLGLVSDRLRGSGGVSR